MARPIKFHMCDGGNKTQHPNHSSPVECIHLMRQKWPVKCLSYQSVFCCRMNRAQSVVHFGRCCQLLSWRSSNCNSLPDYLKITTSLLSIMKQNHNHYMELLLHLISIRHVHQVNFLTIFGIFHFKQITRIHRKLSFADVIMGAIEQYSLAQISRLAGVWGIPIITPGGASDAFSIKSSDVNINIYLHCWKEFNQILRKCQWYRGQFANKTHLLVGVNKWRAFANSGEVNCHVSIVCLENF